MNMTLKFTSNAGKLSNNFWMDSVLMSFIATNESVVSVPEKSSKFPRFALILKIGSKFVNCGFLPSRKVVKDLGDRSPM